MSRFKRWQRVTVTADEPELLERREGGWAGKNGRVLRTEDGKVLVHLGKIYQWAWFKEDELEEYNAFEEELIRAFIEPVDPDAGGPRGCIHFLRDDKKEDDE